MKKKFKTLLPALKERKRYLLFKVISKNKIPESKIKESINQSLFRFLGELGMAKAGIQFVKNDIIRVSHNFVNELKSALMLIKEINNEQVMIRSLKVSGVLNKLKISD